MSLEGWLATAKEAPSPYGLTSLDTKPSFQCLGDEYL